MTIDVTLVLGGAASDKLAWAENYVFSFSKQPIYVATAQAYDDGIVERAALHRQRHSTQWHTLEESLALIVQLVAIRQSEHVLVVNATIWLSNFLVKKNVLKASNEFCTYLSSFDGKLVIVSNEIGHSILPLTKLSRMFQSDQGYLNQKLASNADRVVMVTAGLLMLLKGMLQKGFH